MQKHYEKSKRICLGLALFAIFFLGMGTHLMWIPSLAAFRAGAVNGDPCTTVNGAQLCAWDSPNIGFDSIGPVQIQMPAVKVVSQMKKIEELALYAIGLKKENEALIIRWNHVKRSAINKENS